MWSMTSSAAITAGNDASASASSSNPSTMCSSGSWDATRDAVAVAASRRSCSRVAHAREPLRDLRRDLLEEPVARSEVGLRLPGDEHAERDTVTDERVAAIAGGRFARVHLDRFVPRHRDRRGHAVHGIHLRDHVDRVLQVARGIDARRLDLRQLEQARGFEQLDEQRAIRTGLLQSFEAARLDRVQPRQRLLAGRAGAAHASTPSMSAMRSS